MCPAPLDSPPTRATAPARIGDRPETPDPDGAPGLVAAPGRIRTLVARRPLTVFFALAIALPWICAPIADAIFYSGLPTLLGIALALPFEILVASPLAAALILTALGGGRKAVLALLAGFRHWRVGWRWYAVALTLPPALALLPAYLNVLWGAPPPSTALSGSATALLGVLALRLVNPWDGPISEELGWRGFALPRLQKRYSTLTANLILAAFVMTWHLRLVANGSLPLVALIGTLAATILFGWLFNSTSGSLFLVYLFHATDGVLQPHYAAVDSTRYLWLKVAIWAVAAIGVVLLSGRTLTGLHPRPVRTEIGKPAAIRWR
ncbi:MAG TPA: type II CAAX endopeptidase family protein [Kineosporiaceae bacterium]|nr:type II CAAX endopeptidase family protein [Kineosporiaceae bacterium]